MALSKPPSVAPSRPWPLAGWPLPARIRAATWADVGFFSLLVALVLALYLPSLSYGLIWDDPTWYQQGAGLSPWQIFTSLPTYQFYRPLAILLNRLLVSPAGVVNAPVAHILQVEAHLAATLLGAPVLRALGLGGRHARLAALLFAVFPFSYQAVAWQAPQQPLALFWVMLGLWLADQARARNARLALSLSALSYAAGLLFQESAVPFALAYLWLGWRQRQRGAGPRPAWWPLVHLGLAAAYVLIWLSVPRQAGVTGAGFQLYVLGYLLQGLVFPAAALLAGPLAAWPLPGLVALFAALAAGLCLLAWRATRTRAVAVALAWAAAGSLPVWAGLSWDYVNVGSRVLYPASLGVAALWAAPLAWLLGAREGAWRRAAGWAGLALVLGLSLWQDHQFYRLYQAGTRHLARTVDVLTARPEERLLFVNYPDRLGLRAAPYPLGYWGLTLAPVVQRLADFALAAQGQSAADQSVAVHAAGLAEREAGPYRVDLRGADTPPEALWQAAAEADAVYLTEYGARGELALREVGAVRPALAAAPQAPLATLGAEGDVALIETAVGGAHPAQLRTVWATAQDLPPDATIFVHLWQEGAFVGAVDGDSLGGLLPLFAWQPGYYVVDLRRLDGPGLRPGTYDVTVGVYRRWDGQRLPAYALGGARWPGDEIPAGVLTLSD